MTGREARDARTGWDRWSWIEAAVLAAVVLVGVYGEVTATGRPVDEPPEASVDDRRAGGR